MSKISQGTLFLLALFAAGGASAQSPNFTGKLPDALWPGADQHLAMVVSAKGVQIYECRGSKDRPGGYEWVFIAPDADLFDMGGKRIGRHYAGPHWESYDGSKVLGAVKGSAVAPVADQWAEGAKKAGADPKQVLDSLHQSLVKYNSAL